MRYLIVFILGLAIGIFWPKPKPRSPVITRELLRRPPHVPRGRMRCGV